MVAYPGLIDSPVGPLGLDERKGRIARLLWGRAGDLVEGPLFEVASAALGAYFAGHLAPFDLPLAPAATPFGARFRDALCDIPAGETRSYGEMAQQLGVSAQAIGQACGANPIAIIVPCHRVLGAHGLGGYSGSGGIETKITLLRHENAGGLLI